MNIGAAAKASGVSSKMIRYYESVGLLSAVKRSDAGYRLYNNNDVHNLKFIRNARDMGFSVKEIGALLTLWQDRSRKSADVKSIANQHITALTDRIGKLQSMLGALQQLVQCCAGDDRPECPILADFESSMKS